VSAATLPPAVQLVDFVPMAQRAVDIDADALVRLRSGPPAASATSAEPAAATIAAFVRLPYDVLAGRTIAVDRPCLSFDVTVSADELITWLASAGAGATPIAKDAHWLTPLPPRAGWERIELVPDREIRNLVRSGAQLAQSAASRTGQQALLSSIVLSVTSTSTGRSAEVPLGPISALTRMGFLPRDASAAVDVAPGWIRIAAPYGSTFIGSGSGALGGLDLLGGLGGLR
jgi:hypothetical protein